MVLYVVGPYRAATPDEVDINIARAREVAAALWRKGHAVICPHLNTATWERLYVDIPEQAYLDGYLQILPRCDGVVLVEGWQSSHGSCDEIVRAQEYRLPVYIHEKDVPQA